MKDVSFELTYTALKMFGKQLYSNPGSAVSELVANGIDAKAKDVYISMDMRDKANSIVEIFDNGTGMSEVDIRENYIKIGFNKRVDGKAEKNTMLGRKGIGKLAALYLSDIFTIATKQKNKPPTLWRLDVTNTGDNDTPVLERVFSEVPDYLQCYDRWNKSESGTLIYLECVNFKKMGEQTFKSFKNRLSNFFMTNELGTNIWLNKVESSEDSTHFEKIQKQIAYKNMIHIYTDDVSKFKELSENQYSYPYTTKRGDEFTYTDKTMVENISKVLGERSKGVIDGVKYELKGWIGIHSSINMDVGKKNDPLFLRNNFYRPNKLRVYVRNKLGMENMLDHLGITQAFVNYIEGEIVFDILDDDDLDDIATASRQDYDTQDDRFLKLVELAKTIGTNLVRKRQDLAERIKGEQKKKDLDISSRAKKHFVDEIGEELLRIDSIDDIKRAELETIISNKLEGNIENEPKSEYTIFLSHASKDKLVSDFVYEYLKSKGFNGNLRDEKCEIFYSASGLDTANLEPLSKVIKDIIISKNNDILFFASPNFKKSEFCLFEGGAAWATRSVGDYGILSFSYGDIPSFLTNGKSEVCLNIKEKSDFELDEIKYNQVIAIVNRMITHLNKNRSVLSLEKVELLSEVEFPNKVILKREKKSIYDYMDKEVVDYWKTYVLDSSESYFKEL